MTLAKIRSAALMGIDAYEVIVEVDIHPGQPSFIIVGLPDTAVQESKERVRTAMKNANLEFPGRKLTLNLAPADVRKEGPAFDLPIAVGIMAASGQINQSLLEDTLVVGELALDGAIRSVSGVLSMALMAQERNIRNLLVPAENANEAAVVQGVEVYPVSNLYDVLMFFHDGDHIKPLRCDIESLLNQEPEYEADFSDIKGQENARRAIEIAAAGNHNILLIGPPGSGKTMLARRMPTIMPPMGSDEALATTRIYSSAGMVETRKGLITRRPFRAPHHTSSNAAIVGGGAYPKPGEISLSHNGVLFMDELPEFRREVLESLRQPLEDGIVTVSRVNAVIEYPAVFLLVAAMNPCPCGYYGDPVKPCSCPPMKMKQYLRKISGPLLDRIDMHIEVPRLKQDELLTIKPGETSETIRRRVVSARKMQSQRFKGTKIFANAQMTPKMTREFCLMDDAARDFIRQATNSLGLSARAFDRITKLARTIADLANAERIEIPHIAEAAQLRALDRRYWS